MLHRTHRLFTKFLPSLNFRPVTALLTIAEHAFYTTVMADPLQRAVSRFRSNSRPPGGDGSTAARISAAAFRAAVEQRLRNLERDMADLKGRLNGLIFLVAGTVITQVILKLVQ